jgi:hypothetical protein
MVDHSYHNNHGQDRGRRKKQEQASRKQGIGDQQQARRLTGKTEKKNASSQRRKN